MRRIYQTIMLILVIVLSGCVTATPNIKPKLTVVDLPPIGEQHTVGIGSTLLEKARVFEYDAYELLTTFVHTQFGYKFTAQPGIYAATKVDSQWTYYVAVEPLIETCGLGLDICTAKEGGFRVSTTDGEIRPFEHMNLALKSGDKPNWIKTTYTDVSEPSFRRELLYNGRTGSTIRVLYREFSKDMIRPAFSQELTYDLDEGNMVGFQGIRIEVIETSNIGITYRVLNGFPDLEASK